MKETLGEVRYKVRNTRNSIRDKERSIRANNKRLEDLDEAIMGFSRADDYADYINNYLSDVKYCLENGLGVDGQWGVSTALDYLREESSYSDGKISTAIYQLEQEKNVVNEQITSDRNEINSLSYKLNVLKDKEKSLLNEMIFGGD